MEDRPGRFAGWQRRARQLKTEVWALYLALKHPRTPWYARLVLLLVVGYALSPIDLIPDPIPVLGYLDDLLLVPLGITLALRLVPADVMAECRAQATQQVAAGRMGWLGAVLVALIWLAALVWVIYLVLRL